MNTYTLHQESLESMLTPAQVTVNAPMREHTTFRVGGTADYLVFPASTEEVKKVLAYSRAHDIPLTVIGNGSNLLVRDGGIRGIVLSFGKPFSDLRREGEKIIAGAGCILGAVSQFALHASLCGLEFAVGIPGSLGGAVFMNAGAYDGEMANVVTNVTALHRDGNTVSFTREEMQFGYRHSIFQEQDFLICEVELTLHLGDAKEIRAKMDEFTARRVQKQPLEFASAGSTFQRPVGYFAGTLIEQTGLKGLRVGDAQVSEKHAGFIINRGNASAKDVLRLVEEVQARVMKQHGVMLSPEMRIIGEE